ncbi:sensor histidine kinase [Streptomyces avicenniae]|uniref:sensor histidine kinase n=1 Tax=Streptomyces avicenniae TaxID=500153 RepID=UPI00069C605D|nr:ATP-binding protein [Streptomyces avicenniae]
MVHAGTSQRNRRRAPAAGRWLLPPVLLALGVAVAAFLVPGATRAPLLWCGAAAVLAAAVTSGETVRRGLRIALLEERVERQVADTDALAYRDLPVALRKLTAGRLEEDVMPPPDPGTVSDPRLTRAHRAMLRAMLDVLREKEYQRDSGKRAIVNIAHRIQTEIHRLQGEISTMEFRHDTPEMLGDLMRLEHGINVAGRFATSLSVLGGGRPIRRWDEPITLYDIMRAGSGPIVEYRRVEQHRVIEVAVPGHAAESLIMLLAELLDNATRYSPPGSSVVMNSEEVALGIEISVEDKGTGLTADARRRAEFLLQQGVDGVDLTDLGETARIGLRVAGVLAEHYGIRISLRPSTCGGVRSVVFLPNELIVPVPPSPFDAPPEPAGQGARGWPGPPRGPALPPDEETPEYELGANGLPQRRRRRRPTEIVPSRWSRPADGGAPTAPKDRPSGSAPGGQAPGRTPGRNGAAAAPDQERGPGLWVDAFFAGLRAPEDAPHPGDGTAAPGA